VAGQKIADLPQTKGPTPAEVQSMIVQQMAKSIRDQEMAAMMGNCVDPNIRQNAQRALDQISAEEMRRRKHFEYEQFQREFQRGQRF
jgi:hypothetical protein